MREVNHFPQSSTKVKNEWSYTSATATCLHVMDRKNVIFLYVVHVGVRMVNCIVTIGFESRRTL
jgi:hypothetical protein